MTEGIVIAIITSIGTLIGTVLTVKKQTDLTLYRIQQLEHKQDKHNTLIERMYRVEERQDLAEERIKVANHRIDDLEHKAS